MTHPILEILSPRDDRPNFIEEAFVEAFALDGGLHWVIPTVRPFVYWQCPRDTAKPHRLWYLTQNHSPPSFREIVSSSEEEKREWRVGLVWRELIEKFPALFASIAQRHQLWVWYLVKSKTFRPALEIKGIKIYNTSHINQFLVLTPNSFSGPATILLVQGEDVTQVLQFIDLPFGEKPTPYPLPVVRFSDLHPATLPAGDVQVVDLPEGGTATLRVRRDTNTAYHLVYRDKTSSFFLLEEVIDYLENPKEEGDQQ